MREQIVPCWNCRYCQRGQYWMCQVHDIYGFRQRTLQQRSSPLGDLVLLEQRSAGEGSAFGQWPEHQRSLTTEIAPI